MKRIRVCAIVGCPNLQPCPTPGHTRPPNAAWSPQRDHKAHMRLRRQVITTRGPFCERCGWAAPTPAGQGLHMHHIRPGDTPADVQLLCQTCHRAVDTHAR